MNGEWRLDPPLSPLGKGGGRPVACAPGSDQRAAFTLVEMVIVIAIIILLAGLVLPAASQMWRDRNIADAQNMIAGMLMTARARALESSGGETGLFFYVDGDGVQHVAVITQNPNDPNETDATKKITTWQTDPRWHNVFTVSRGRTYALPKPMRVVPRYVICGSTPETTCTGYTETFNQFEVDKGELENNDPQNPPTLDPGQRHRNFFTVIYSSGGELLVGRDVVIRDLDEIKTPTEPPPLGDITGIGVAGEAVGAELLYKTWEDNADSKINVPTDLLLKKPFEAVVVDDDNNAAALNFPSVDGLLVYDDSLFNQSGDAKDKRKYLLGAAQPFYIHRLTGAVVRGPVGEGPTQ